MRWDDIRMFLSLARHPRLAQAARAVAQDPTTLSRRIQRLEREVQATLFERTRAGYRLTERGQQVLAQAEAMEAAALDIGRDADDGAVSGTIRLGVTEGFGARVLAPRLAGFAAAHPRVHIDLIATTGLINLTRREADLAVMLARPDRGPLVARRLADYRLGLYAAPAYLAAAPLLARAADLPRHRLVGYVGDLIHAPELRYLSEIDARLEVALAATGIIAQAELVAAGAGCGILPCFIGDTTPGVIRLLPEIDIARSFWLVAHRDARRVRRVERFVAWLEAATGDARPILMGDQART